MSLEIKGAHTNDIKKKNVSGVYNRKYYINYKSADKLLSIEVGATDKKEVSANIPEVVLKGNRKALESIVLKTLKDAHEKNGESLDVTAKVEEDVHIIADFILDTEGTKKESTLDTQNIELIEKCKDGKKFNGNI